MKVSEAEGRNCLTKPLRCPATWPNRDFSITFHRTAGRDHWLTTSAASGLDFTEPSYASLLAADYQMFVEIADEQGLCDWLTPKS